MPGVNSANYKLIMNEMEDLSELIHASQKRLKDLIGEELGRKLHNFIHKK